MQEIKYYEDIDNHFLLAHESETEFFVKYNPNTNEWENCNVSFSTFKHDYYFREIDKKEALTLSNGNLPEAKFNDYIRMINRNKGINV